MRIEKLYATQQPASCSETLLMQDEYLLFCDWLMKPGLEARQFTKGIERTSSHDTISRYCLEHGPPKCPWLMTVEEEASPSISSVTCTGISNADWSWCLCTSYAAGN